jgi:hypothetical protein
MSCGSVLMWLDLHAAVAFKSYSKIVFKSDTIFGEVLELFTKTLSFAWF